MIWKQKVTVKYVISRKVFLHYNAKIRGSIGAKSHIYAIRVYREACNYEAIEQLQQKKKTIRM